MSRTMRHAAATLFAMLCFVTSFAVRHPESALASPAAAEVSILDQGQVGRFRIAIVSVRARCHAPWLVQDLSVEVSQAGATAGSVSGVFGLVCDNAVHLLTLSVGSFTGDPFEPGPAQVAALLTVLDPVSLDPVGQAGDSRTVDLLAPAEVKIAALGVVTGSGTAQVFVRARCQRPWVIQELVVELAQEQDSGTAAGVFGLACDGRWHHRVVRITPAPGEFERGPAAASLFFTVLDPIDFDPVYQAKDSETVSLVGA